MARPTVNAATLSPIIGLSIAAAILYFARDLLMPLAFALLLAFLLTPIVKVLESWRIPRAPASLIVILVASAALIVVGWLVTTELLGVAVGLPKYSDNVRRKIEALQGRSTGLNQLISSLEDMGKQISTTAPNRPLPSPTTAETAPSPVEIVEQHNILQTVRQYAGIIMKPAGTLFLIFVFTIFMLIDRENLRNRLLRLMGQQKLQATTKAMDDAGQRVSRYVLMQFLVNVGFGAVTGIGLMLLGVPNWPLWGVLGALLRFLPYIGPIIAGFLPFVLSLAVSDGWRTPLSVVGLYLVSELIIGNAVEPLLYGVHTGLSAVAILVSAVFWTVLWGPIGLVLSTPLTVCLSALGRHSAQLEFLNVVLGDEQVLTSDVLFYQRLLALDQQDALNVLDTLGKDKPLIALFDEIVIPALAMAERDRHTGQLDSKREDFIVQSINELVTELSEADQTQPASVTKSARVFCLPAHDTADEIAAAMCAHFFTREGYPAIAFPVTDAPGELMKSLAVQPEDIVCISSIPPFAAGNARRVAKDIRQSGVTPRLVAGLWTYESTTPARAERLQKTLSVHVVTCLRDAVSRIQSLEEKEESSNGPNLAGELAGTTRVADYTSE